MTTNIKNIYEEIVPNRDLRKFESDRCAGRLPSWDTYIFHKSKLMGKLMEENLKCLSETNELVPFYMNESGAENAALWALQQSYPFSSTYNVCDRIQSWHFHLTKKTHKARETPWLQVSDRNSPLFTPPELVPKPHGFPQKAS
eukprot:scaffold9027_cov86-Skeletonema_dohrnii-CCMP3373.AAC.2